MPTRVPVRANFKHNCALLRGVRRRAARRRSVTQKNSGTGIGGIDGRKLVVNQRFAAFFCIEVDMLARFVAFFLVVGSLFALAGCNTVDGVGQDISGAARTVKRAL
ncbi:hypothetical protein [Pandoraea anhela]|nr:hypothetical protein [Pandoraea anhela]